MSTYKNLKLFWYVNDFVKGFIIDSIKSVDIFVHNHFCKRGIKNNPVLVLVETSMKLQFKKNEIGWYCLLGNLY